MHTHFDTRKHSVLRVVATALSLNITELLHQIVEVKLEVISVFPLTQLEVFTVFIHTEEVRNHLHYSGLWDSPPLAPQLVSQITQSASPSSSQPVKQPNTWRKS